MPLGIHGARDALIVLDIARSNARSAMHLARTGWVLGSPTEAFARARADIRRARRALIAAGQPIPARRHTRHAKEA